MAASDAAETFRRALVDEVANRVAGYTTGIVDVYQRVVPRESGELASALRVDTEDAGGGSLRLHGEVDEAVAPHGKWIDQPVAEIVPVNARALRWLPRSGGGPVFARSVTPSRVHEGWWEAFVDTATNEVIRS